MFLSVGFLICKMWNKVPCISHAESQWCCVMIPFKLSSLCLSAFVLRLPYVKGLCTVWSVHIGWAGEATLLQVAGWILVHSLCVHSGAQFEGWQWLAIGQDLGDQFCNVYVHAGSILGRLMGSISVGLRGKEDWAREGVEHNDSTTEASAKCTGCSGAKVIHRAMPLEWVLVSIQILCPTSPWNS